MSATEDDVYHHIHELGNEFYEQYSSLVAQFLKRAVEKFDLDALGLDPADIGQSMAERMQELSSVYGSSYDKYTSGEKDNYLILPPEAAGQVTNVLTQFAYTHSDFGKAIDCITKHTSV